MKLTDAAGAADYRADQRARSEIVGLRVGIRTAGCAGQPLITVGKRSTRSAPTDESVEDKGVKSLSIQTAVLFLLGTEMDYKADRCRRSSSFNNPKPEPAPAAAAIRAG